MKVVIESQDIKAVQETARKYHGLELTKDQAKELFDDVYFAGNYLSSGIDTYVRGILSDLLASKLTEGKFTNWPMNGDSRLHTNSFYRNYVAGAEKLGYKVVEGVIF